MTNERPSGNRTVVTTKKSPVGLSGGFFTFTVDGLEQIATETSGDPKILLMAHNTSGLLAYLASGMQGVAQLSGAYGISGNSFPVALYSTGTSGVGLSGIVSLATGVTTSGIPVTAVVEGW